ncbi:MAG TPA: hypothetical protein VIB99_01550, partial [Candidatus Limnocylindrales bacterium]
AIHGVERDGLRPELDGIHQARLANPGFARQEQETAPSRSGRPDVTIGRFDQRFTPDEARRYQLSETRHVENLHPFAPSASVK